MRNANRPSPCGIAHRSKHSTTLPNVPSPRISSILSVWGHSTAATQLFIWLALRALGALRNSSGSAPRVKTRPSIYFYAVRTPAVGMTLGKVEPFFSFLHVLRGVIATKTGHRQTETMSAIPAARPGSTAVDTRGAGRKMCAGACILLGGGGSVVQ